jgi:hypothetical protein
MASQLYGTSGNRRLKRNQGAELRTRQSYFPTILAQEQGAKQAEEQKIFQEKEFKQSKENYKDQRQFSQDQAKQGFGLEVGKLGINLATSGYNKGGGRTVGEMLPQPGPDARTDLQTSDGRTGKVIRHGGYFNNIQPASLATGGLAGFGIGNMFSGESKKKKALYGMGAGLLSGMLSGGGALESGLGGLFGGMVA